MSTSRRSGSPDCRRAFAVAALLCATAATALAQFVPHIAPSSLSVARGAAGSFQASITPSFVADPVQVSWLAPGGLPAGLTITPATGVLSPPGYAPATFAVLTAASTPVGTYPVTFAFLLEGDISVTEYVDATIVVKVAGDYHLHAPPALSLLPGATGTASVEVDGTGGFTQPVTIRAPTGTPDVTVTPSQATCLPGGSQQFQVAVAASANPRTLSLRFRGESAGYPNRSATTSLTILPAPDFSLAASPPSVPLTAGGPPQSATVTLMPINAFSGVVSVTASVVPAGGVVVTPPVFDLSPASAARTVTFSAPAGATPGAWTVTFTGASGALVHAATVQAIVAAAPDFSLAASPPNVSLLPGGAPQPGSIALTAANGFAGSVAVTAAVTPANGGVLVAPSTFELSASSPTRSVTFSAPPGATACAYAITFTGTSGALVRSTVVQAVVVNPPDFSLSASPSSIEVRAGDPAGAPLTLSATGLHGLACDIQVAPPTLAGVAFTPSSCALRPGGSIGLTVRAERWATPGTPQLVLTGTASGVAGTRSTAPVSLTILPADPPEIDRVTPPGAVQGTRSASFRLTGRNFKQGAVALATGPGLRVERTSILSPTMADVVLSIAGDAPLGPARIDLRNPNGGSSAEGARILVYPPAAIGAPLGVTTAAIVHPIDGSIVATNEALYPRALLATTGTGTIVGAWRLDGVEFDRFTAATSAGLPVEVRTHVKAPAIAWGEHRLELVVERPASAESAAVRVIATVGRATRLLLLEPEDRATVSAGKVRFRWSLQPGVEGYRVEIQRRAGEAEDSWEPILAEVTGRADWSPGERQRAALGTGSFRWRVRPIHPVHVDGDPTPWSHFELVRGSARSRGGNAPLLVASAGGVSWSLGDADPQGPAAAAVAAPARTWTDYLLAPMTTLDWAEHGDPAGRVQLSSQADVRSASGNFKLTGDASWRGVNDPENHFAQESHSWVAGLGASEDRAFRPEVVFGFTVPDFTAGSEFVTPGFAQTGGTARLTTRVGSIGYYQPTVIATHGVLSALPAPDLRLFAFETPQGKDWSLKLFRFESTKEEDFYSPATDVEAWGLLGRLQITPSLGLAFELAESEARGRVDGDNRSRSGSAARVALNGFARGISFGVNARYTEPRFVNPASANLTAGAIADRRTVDMNLARSFGRASVSLLLMRTETGTSGGSTTPEASSTAANLSVSSTLGNAAVSLSGNATLDRGDADSDLYLPATDRTQRGVSLSFAEPMGRFSLAQTIGLQRTRDRVHSFSDMDVTDATLSISGSVATNVSMATSLSGVRSKGSADVGTTDSVTLSLQPGWALPARYLALTPSVSWQRSRNDDSGVENDNKFYQASLQWSPPWMGSLLSFQASAGWSRGRSSFAGFESETRTRVIQASLTLHQTRHAGSAAAAASPLPGATAMAPPPAEVSDDSLETVSDGEPPAVAGSGSG